MTDVRTDGPRADASVAELTRHLTELTTRLVRDEVELAKAELDEKAKSAGIGAGMLSAAALTGLYALGALTAAAIMALSTAVDAWLAALIVAGAYAVLAGLVAMVGKARVRRATPPVPERALESAKEDIEWTKQRFKTARQ
jgi:hypothetical protein